ncbi:MAG: 16S rRNA (cytosine(1402)-N(4))-methyltransferase RsmH [Pseudomonadota bacterium]|nr:16S rRNA (cytosine(1402)-N(4))-methyltransferase RsmH [Pseudomonadota bacterium]
MSEHVSVLLEESVDALAIEPNGTYMDCTFGRGGHSRKILAALGEQGRLIGFDQDPEAIRVGEALAHEDSRFSIVHSNFSDVESVISSMGLLGKVDGVLMDLGVSSPQLDQANRGFSFQQDGPLDMRMNTAQAQTAEQWLNHASESELADVFWRYGEERFSRKLAAAIVMDREKQPFTRTKQLADMIARVLPNSKEKKHPATRAFQAIRIQVNAELESLVVALEAMPKVLAHGGRLSVISFHSLEDRLVKQFYKPKQDPRLRGLPVQGEKVEMKAVGKPLKASAQEVDANPRSRSAVLRVFECQ